MAEVSLSREDAALVEELRQKYSNGRLGSTDVTSSVPGKYSAAKLSCPSTSYPRLPTNSGNESIFKRRCGLQMKSGLPPWGQSAKRARARAYS